MMHGNKQRDCALLTRCRGKACVFVPLSSPWPILPSRPMTTLHGRDVTCTRPRHHSHSFCKPTRLTEPFFLRALRQAQHTGVK